MKLAIRACPICTGSRVDVLHTQRFAITTGSPLPREYDVVACAECGLVYADTPAPQRDYDRYYEEFSKYEDPAIATGGGATSADRARLEQLADQLLASAGASARVLDVGCAGGGLLSALRERGFTRLEGLDAAPACVEQVRAQGIDARCLRVSDLSSLQSDERDRFDLIVLSHVIEHVVDLRPLVSSVRTLMSERGLVYIEVPDASRYLQHGTVPFYFFDAEHINHFDLERLKRLGLTADLAMVSSGIRTLVVALDRTYPACWALFQPRHGERLAPAPATSHLRDCVTEYIRRSQAELAFPELDRLAVSGRPVVVWGAGSFAQRLFGERALDACNIVAIVDRDHNKHGRPFAGFTVEAPEAAVRRNPGAVILVVAAMQDGAITRDARALTDGGEVVTLTTPRA